MIKRILAATLAAALMSSGAFAGVLTWTCSFPSRTDPNGGGFEHMDLIFKVDTASQRAYMEGNLGILEVQPHVGDRAFSFVELVDSGAVQSTTITPDGNAIHSRNTVIAGEFVPAQRFGRCTYSD